jgi:hypothetical protein
MFEWLKKIANSQISEPPAVSADDAVAIWCQMASASAIDDVWDALDANYEEVRDEVRELVEDDRVGDYPRFAGILFLSYQLGNRGERLDAFLEGELEDAICWALQFQTNHVLTGGAMGSLDALAPDKREQMARNVFSRMGHENTRRFWLLMKVRTDAFVGDVARELRDHYDPSDRRRVVGGFRQFTADDIPVLAKHYDPESPGADLFIEALGATRSREASELVAAALGHADPLVRETAMRAMRLIGGS